MAQKNLNMNIVLNGMVSNGFGQLGQALVTLGSQVDQISQKLINFGKESLNVYRDYEDSMLEARGALSTEYGRETRELTSVMEGLDAAAKEWAGNSSFTTEDVANAINEAAHANWNYEQILEGIPAAMDLAKAGGLDLSEALGYVITSTKAAGIGFDELTQWTDVWAFAANSSAGTIREFGDAMDKMGGTMKFADSKEELVTLLAVLHNNGTKGAAAGTLLRNSMIRLIAPTKKASDVMAELGLSESELDEILGESTGDLDAASDALEQAGFSAYDSEGNLKGFLEIFTDLNKAIGGMSEEERNNVLGAIFPTRTITGAIALLDAASQSYDGLYAAMEAGDAEGYGQYLSELMMSGLTGSTKLLESKVENLKLLVGEYLAPDIERIQGFIGGIVDKVSGLDDEAFAGIGGAAKVIAAAGPLLLVAGGALKLIGTVLSGPLAIGAAGVLGIGAVAVALTEINEVRYEGIFGTMALDAEAFNAALQAQADKFDAVWQRTTTFKGALEDLVSGYETAATRLSGDLLTDSVLGKNLTDDDIERLNGLGSEMSGYVKQAIIENGDYNAAFWTALFSYNADGTTASDAEVATNPIFQAVIGILNTEQTDLLAQVDALDAEFSAALSEALFDHTITADERERLMDYFRQYNELMAQAEQEAKNEQDYITRQTMMKKAQSLSWEEFQTYNEENLILERQRQLDTINEQFDAAVWRMQYRYENGQLRDENGELYTQERYDELIAGLEAERAEAIAGIYGWFDDIQMGMAGTMLGESDLAGLQDRLAQFRPYLESGLLTLEEASMLLNSEGFNDQNLGGRLLNPSGVTQLLKYYRYIDSMLGGEENIAARMEQYKAAGDMNRYNQLKTYRYYYEMLANAMEYEENAETGYISPYEGFSLEDLIAKAQTMAELGFTTPLEFWNNAMNGVSDSALTNKMVSEYPELYQAMMDKYLESQTELARRGFGAMEEKAGQKVYGANFSGIENTLALMSDMELQAMRAWMYNNGMRNFRALEGELFAMDDEAFADAVDANGNLTALEYYWLAEKRRREMERRAALEEEQRHAAKEQADYYADKNDGGKATWTGTMWGQNLWRAEEAYVAMVEDPSYKYKSYFQDTWGKWHGILKPGYGASVAELAAAMQEMPSAESGLNIPVTFPGAKENAEAANSDIHNAIKDVKVPVSFINGSGGSMGGGVMGGITSFANIGRFNFQAKGGRETEPSIFAEAGIPEWFIPEEHTANTARLILGAAYGSGFDLVELAEAAGARMFEEGGTTGALPSLSWSGLSDATGSGGDYSSSIQVQYSPVIHAENADGVRRALEEDRKRFEKWIDEWFEKRELYEDIVRYEG